MKSEAQRSTITTSAHNVWSVAVHHYLTEKEYLTLTLGHVKATHASFRTSGQALGWIKRLAKSEPGGDASFNIVCWAEAEQPWDIYFE